jgi:Zn-dependent peptidase ImmA (M78 family)
MPRTPVRDAYETHEKYWADSNGDLAVPIDPISIASAMGIDVFTEPMKESQDGYLEPNGPNGKPAIFLNQDHSLARIRFTCAHELGHFVEHQKRHAPLTRCDRDPRASSGTDPQEIYSNRFAAALLMPKAFLMKLHNDGLSVDALARRFKVSRAAVIWRLRNLGVEVSN